MRRLSPPWHTRSPRAVVLVTPVSEMLTAAKRLASPTVARCKSTPTYVLMIIRYERSASSTDGASHLRVLRSARLVTAERRNRQRLYRLVNEHVRHIVTDALQHALEHRVKNAAQAACVHVEHVQSAHVQLLQASAQCSH
jgi:hypothetical protein